MLVILTPIIYGYFFCAQWMREGKGFLLVYSIDSRNTFDEISVFKEKILRAKDMDKVPMCVFCISQLSCLDRLSTRVAAQQGVGGQQMRLGGRQTSFHR